VKHPPSKTIGRKHWLAKVWTSPEAHIDNDEYCFSPADFDPRGLTLTEAREAGKATTLLPPYGSIYGAQIWRMAHEAEIGDVIFLESENRHVHAWGTITSTYQLLGVKNPTRDKLLKTGIHQIGVEWRPVSKGRNAFRIDKGDKLLFREIADQESLQVILKSFIDGPLTTKEKQSGDDALQDLEYTEGSKVLRTHLRTERVGNAVKLAKALARKRSRNGKLTCEACACVPEEDYAGLDLIEAHHCVPLSLGVRETKPTDFAMLCPSCHRAVHKLIDRGLKPEVALINVKRP
jgi:5-methylcytosine-specific restriction endonuclease McrA